jgi:ribosomal protein L37AE/L43A
VLSTQPPLELELRGLTAAEMELIRAYLDRDLGWLRGWHAAAQEMAQIEQLPSSRKAGRSGHKTTAALPGKVKPLLKRRLQLCCALCGTVAGWQSGNGVQVCKACGSQLFRASNHR